MLLAKLHAGACNWFAELMLEMLGFLATETYNRAGSVCHGAVVTVLDSSD